MALQWDCLALVADCLALAALIVAQEVKRRRRDPVEADYGQGSAAKGVFRRLLGAEATDTSRGSSSSGPECVVCMQKPHEAVIDPCGHISMCIRCAERVDTCPICRGSIDKVLRVFVS